MKPGGGIGWVNGTTKKRKKKRKVVKTDPLTGKKETVVETVTSDEEVEVLERSKVFLLINY